MEEIDIECKQHVEPNFENASLRSHLGTKKLHRRRPMLGAWLNAGLPIG